SSGVISGTIDPNTAKSSPFTSTITASDGTFSGSRTLIWSVTPVVTFNFIVNQTSKEGDSPNVQVTATDSKALPLPYSATGLPTGLSIAAGPGLISGTIASGAAASSPFTTIVTATDGTFSNDLTFTWTVGT